MEFKKCFCIVWLLHMLYCMCCFTITNGHILICENKTKQLMEEFSDMPAQFGGIIPSTGIKVFLKTTNEGDFGCQHIIPPPVLPKPGYPLKAHFAILIQRGNCTFEEKVRNAQAANYSLAIIYNNRSDDLEHMSAKNATGIRIPSVFVGKTTGGAIRGFTTGEVYLIVDDELPFNINTHLILPFCILLGICFLIMILYMIYKCVRAERRLRRHRLPKRLLRKLPIRKYTKNGDLPYDTCVICLDEFIEGDKLRILPCKHAYHSKCIDPWLTKSKRECPICKRKLFTKRESRLQRIRRQSPLDSVTDTEDDTTPLMQQSNTSAASSSLNRHLSNSNSNSHSHSHTSTTRHGTFRRNARSNSNASDVGQQFSSTGSDGGGQASESSDTEMLISAILRVNPFDRQPNLPAHLDAQLNAEPTNQRSIRSWSIAKRLLRFDETEPPYQDMLDDVVTGMVANNNANRANSRDTMNVSDRNVGRRYDYHDNDNDDDDDDDDEEPMLSIYEPANYHTAFSDILESHQLDGNIINLTDDDAACFHTPPSSDILTSDPVHYEEEVQHQYNPDDDDSSAHFFA